MKRNFEKFCEDYENIENYDKAKKDNFKGWDCHHRLETHNSDGERRLVDITVAELKALGMYYNRPAEELIFLRKGEHSAIRKVSEETKKKMVAAKEGENHPMYGKKHSVETINKMSEAHKNISEETRNKMREARKGEKNPMYGKHHSEETRKKMGEAKKGNTYAKGNKSTKGKHWFNNGEKCVRAKECPEGFFPGRLTNK